jgi:phosphoglycolate phosphatase
MLKGQGFRLGIVSTKFRYRIETILKRDKLIEPFDVIVGGEDVASHKPDPESLLLAMDKIGARLENVVYVGDSVVDAKTAENVGIPFIAVLSGVTPESAFDGYPRMHILESVHDLPTLINHLE